MCHKSPLISKHESRKLSTRYEKMPQMSRTSTGRAQNYSVKRRQRYTPFCEESGIWNITTTSTTKINSKRREALFTRLDESIFRSEKMWLKQPCQKQIQIKKNQPTKSSDIFSLQIQEQSCYGGAKVIRPNIYSSQSIVLGYRPPSLERTFWSRIRVASYTDFFMYGVFFYHKQKDMAFLHGYWTLFRLQTKANFLKSLWIFKVYCR